MAYHCLFNLDMGSIPMLDVPVEKSSDELNKETIRYFVNEVGGTDVDAYMCCPTFLRLPLWRSALMPHWTDNAPYETEPVLPANFVECAYYRYRRYILAGGDPVGDIVEACKEKNIAVFFSYRMNDVHHLYDPENKNLDSFWREHPEYNMNTGWTYTEIKHQNYIYDEVREHYFQVLEELTRMYDIDGLELDFMRDMPYFQQSDLEQGRKLMTAFVARVRGMLDRYGKTRGKQLRLCVRVASDIAACLWGGLDIAEWVRTGIVDMLNIAPRNTFTLLFNTRIDEYKAIAPHLPVYAELEPFLNHSERGTTQEELTTAIHHYLSMGADGISFFNMSAQHRRFYKANPLLPSSMHPELDPEWFRNITNREALADLPRHYFIHPQSISSVMPDPGLTHNGKWPIQMWETTLRMFDIRGQYREGVLRVELTDFLPTGGSFFGQRIVNAHGFPLIAVFNGQELTEYTDSGELFRPTDLTDLPSPLSTRYYHLPPELLKDENRIEFRLYERPGNSWDKRMEINGLEIALY